jgi:FtsP/CotA-like multicopper oxidase with cupredoxin domain
MLSLAALARGGTPAVVTANDNRRPAGRLAGGVLAVTLEARAGVWRPEGPDGPALAVAAFAEPGAAPSTPGPLLRAPAGTEVRTTVRNALAVPITVHGLGAPPGEADSGTTIAPGAEHAFRFRAGTPGMTYYLAYAGPRRPPMVRFHDDGQLHGAIVVDPPRAAGATPAADRVFVISAWFTRDTTTVSGLGPNAVLAINGLSWPFTERLTMAQRDTARWRVINASLLDHPMHLHGAHFRVDARGDGARDTVYTPDQRRLAVTELLPPGRTMQIAWTPVHPGNWVFHCHFASHIVVRGAFEADRRMPVRPTLASTAPGGAPTVPAVLQHAGHGGGPQGALHNGIHGAPGPDGRPRHMEGLVLGVTVTPRGPAPVARGPERALRLIARSRASVYGEYAGYGYVLGGSPAEAVPDSLPVPGPLLELVRGERVAVTLVNHAHEAMAVHWHGIELESYPDGVPGWSGAGARTLPMIAPGDSLTVRFTPPRAGTFMYHSHANEMQQISSGMYGTIVVSERAAPRDPATDHVVVFSDDGPTIDFFKPPVAVRVNGSARPAPLVLAAGRTHRLRLVNIRTEVPTALALRAHGDAAADSAGAPARWRVVAKDGATIPPARVREVPATLLFAPGEIYDVEITPRAGQTYTLRWEGDPGNPASAGTMLVRAR